MPNAQPTKETRYYISSLDFNEASAREIAYYIREHWGIENRLHWQLDVTSREDACRARKNFSARNLNLIRKFSLAILRRQHDTLSLKARRWKCSLRIDYLKQVLGFLCGSPSNVSGLTHNTQLKFARAQDRITASGLVWPATSAPAVLIYPAFP